MIGKLLGSIVRVVNSPLRAIEKTLAIDEDEPDKIVSKPLDKLAESLEEADDDNK